MKNYNLKPWQCILNDQRFIGIDKIVMDSNSDSNLQIFFDSLSNDLEGKIAVCNFNSYINVNIVDEYYDTCLIVHPYTNVNEDESVLSKFGPVSVYENSPWIEKTMALLGDSELLPKHYLFVTVDDVIEVVSLDVPEFKIID